MPTVHAIPAFSDNYIWALVSDNVNKVAIVDPGDAAPVTEFLQERQLELGAILITHHHPDHTGGIGALLENNDVPVYGPAHESQPITGLSARLTEGDRIDIDWLRSSFDVIDVPGHTAGHIALYGDGMLFSGDTLFSGGCGKLFEGSAAQMRQSLAKLRALAQETRIYCGHEYTVKNLEFAQAVEPENKQISDRLQQVLALRDKNEPSLPSTLALELKINPFLRWDEHSVVEAASGYSASTSGDEDSVFAAIRKWKDEF